ncbi:hypothetical protein J5J10_03650 [Ciceribacter sp. L1K23]|uniref:hypothetical protein n=1 Tax=Ciceribacter sp. L1K23 TaxID=2820276 RepID=UPI001B83F915|nr:hypothetical protein [Ciceribacter sp. L1K23]MBR0554764.1 hypothetical protein [Ciceribacter sp. L1K23]
MIEYALLFGLGVLTTALIVMLVAPAVHRRIVRFTENRLRATVPLSPQEIRAQKDMARAVYAAENAKTMQELVREREKAMALQVQNDELAKEASRLLADHEEMRISLEEMEVTAGQLRSDARRYENDALSLSEMVRRLEEASAAKDIEIEQMLGRLQKLAYEIDTLKIESAAREAEIENLKQRVQSLRDEREDLRREAKLAGQRAKEAEQRLIQEEHTRLRIDDRLTRQIAENADKDAQLERRANELSSMREKLKAANAAARAATRALRSAKILIPTAAEGDFSDPPEEPRIDIASRRQPPAAPTIDLDRMAEELTLRQEALTDRLLKSKGSENDDALREEISDLAARMIVLTSLKEGRTSPIGDLLPGGASLKDSGKRTNLGERARVLRNGIEEKH